MNNQFAAVVEINADIQTVVNEARRLYLVSLNAMLLARRSGQRAAAFQRVTGELRLFSDRMQHEMDGLRSCICELVRRFSEVRRHGRALALVERAEALARAQGWHGHMGESRERARRLAAASEAADQHFVRAVGSALRLCGIGENLSVLAKVEAANTGGEEAGRLIRVAEELSELVGRMRSLLERAGRQVEFFEMAA